MEVQRHLGVPFPEQTKEEIAQQVATQEQTITADLKNSGAEVEPDREIVALISYLQKLGKCEQVKKPAPAAAANTAAK
jgi:cytochrome c oxidase cbb3-type subunit I/II